ncbi:MAG: hypothetical protein KME25_16120 [Symplocastrum torsivum CPER-KK1]|uniref:Uncharacterized protein n=1 Tax=Symplocastrum torsivum CPER-KK1 TaxID=450513 RepID=A0A951U9Z4_9CYAN|nr:hypothetical protein [Symplocastrum torsivum CPER-KK1]
MPFESCANACKRDVRKTFSNTVALVAIVTLILLILINTDWLIGIEPKSMADSTLPR